MLFDFDQLRFFRLKWSCSSASIQYKSTGVGSLPSLDEIEPERTVRGFFSYSMALSEGRAC